ncbi:TetR/AcrR family transcriptional regulator [Actinoplanes awajinensis]|uniref:TetR family transcriptional regulator n=1 Tax=Actinoplanes awajinensis subsp. mycoplanecinus TaxID=135947 RepID=A0A101JJH1_9ACTN|nr:TetR/AcrR family transcriptional regulator [Actinoplanes awajinensis]KUL28028.1 TetR family transcriptional regulator [Actinoplanes awajinensis subsp. mycoplanecinus]
MTPLRADAAENRARILQVAKEVVSRAATVEEIRLNEIAKAAGVGQGTLYRHFPTRDALLLEVYRRDVDEMCDAAEVLVRDLPAAEALERWLERVEEYAWVKRGVFASVEAAMRTDVSEHSHRRINEAVGLLLAAGRAARTVRDDVDARDIVLLIGYLSRVTPEEQHTRAPRLRAIVLDGLRPHLPG